MDPELQAMTMRVSELALTTTAANVYDRINARKARKHDKQTINDLEEIINELLDEKQELVRISTVLGDRLRARSLTPEEVEYVTNVFIPKLSEVAVKLSASGGDELQEVIDLVRPLVSPEMVTMMQLIGFDFRRAIGEPLTQLAAQLIRSRTPPTDDLELARLERETEMLRVAQDEHAYARLYSQ